jgi:hypothetical protein
MGARLCLVLNTTAALDGTPTGDKYKGTVCSPLVTSPPAIADGAECLYLNPDGTRAHFSDVCVDDDECYLTGGQPAGQGFDAAGDNRCHKLCYAGSCPPGSTCRDVFGLFTTTNPVGMCL